MFIDVYSHTPRLSRVSSLGDVRQIAAAREIGGLRGNQGVVHDGTGTQVTPREKWEMTLSKAGTL